MTSGHNTDERDPFAPPPEGSADRPWKPRRSGGSGSGSEGGSSGSGSRPAGPPRGSSGQGSSGRGSSGGRGPEPSRPAGGPQRPGGQGPRSPREGRDGGRGPLPGPGGVPPRFDPADPVQRRARYALLGGMWGVFFCFFGYVEIGLLLGALALYWGISSLRGQRRGATPEAEAENALAAQQHRTGAPAARTGNGPAGGPRPASSAAVGGIIASVAALALVAATFTVQLVYKDYFTCVSDALTDTAKQSCSTLLPEPLHNMFGAEGVK